MAYASTASNGLEVTGGKENRFALSVFQNNWGSDVITDGVANTKFRDNDLTNSNKSAYCSDGNLSNTCAFLIKGMIANPDRKFLLELLDTQIHSTDAPIVDQSYTGIYLDPTLNSLGFGQNIINIDDVGLIGFHNQIDMGAITNGNVRITLGDNRHQDYVQSPIVQPQNGSFYSLPYNNHVTKLRFPDFKLDGTGTSIIITDRLTGLIFNYYPINSLHIDVTTMHLMMGDKIQLELIDRANVSVDGNLLSLSTDSLTANVLNSMFERVEIGGGDINPPDPTLIGEPEILVDGTNYNSSYMSLGLPDANGNQTLISTQTGDNRGDVWSDIPMDQLGEFTQFQTDSAGGGKRFYIGFTTADQLSNLGDGVGNGHEGLQWSLAIYDGYDAPWTFYGTQSSYSYSEFFTNKELFRTHSGIRTNKVTWKVGIDANDGRFYVYFWSIIDLEWKYVAKTGYSLPNGDYHAVVRFYTQGGGFYGDFTNYRFPETDPVLTWNYIESPDGIFHYPLFATQEEAIFADTQEGGTGTFHSHVYVDDTTNTIWYMPDSLPFHNQNAAPSGNTLGTFTDIVWNEIATDVDSNYAPASFGNQTIYVNEGDSLNLQIVPAGATFVTTIGGIPNWSLNGNMLQGTAPEVPGDNVSNPSDTTTVTVYRTNSYGTSQGTLTIVIANLTPPQTVTGISHIGNATLAGTVSSQSTWYQLNESLSAGERLIITGTFLDDIFEEMNVFDNVVIGLKSSTWSASDNGYAFGTESTTGIVGNFKIRLYKNQNSQKFAQLNYNNNTVALGTPSFLNGNSMSALNLFIELTSSGNNIRGGWEFSNSDDVNNTTYGNWTNTNKAQTGDQGFGLSSGTDVVIWWDRNASTSGDFDYNEIDWTELGEQAIPTAPTISTPWTKALDFSGSNQHAAQVSSNNNYTPISLDNITTTISPNTDSSKTVSNFFYGRPFATAIVFKIDGSNTNQHIWNQGGGVNDDNIYLRVSANRTLHFGWGRDGSGVNELVISNGILDTNSWYGIYIAHKGERYSANNASSVNLANAFDVRLMSSYDGFTSLSSNQSVSGRFSGGARMDRNYGGLFTIGGRGSNRSFQGKIASMVVTTLKLDDLMPTDAEIRLMITDPVKWLQDYKVGQSFRRAYDGGTFNSFQVGNSYSAFATQVWLMGDTSLDSYSNMIRNYVYPADQNYTKLQLNSMVSNDIETVNINGLT